MIKFDNVEKRIVNTYLETYPDFYPDKIFDEKSQREFYNFLKSVYHLIYEEPERLFSKVHPDGFFIHRFNKSSDNMPELEKNIRYAIRCVDELNKTLISMMTQGVLKDTTLTVPKEVKVSSRIKNILEASGITNVTEKEKTEYIIPSPALANGWRLMANRYKEDLPSFSRSMFDPDHSYVSDIYSRLLKSRESFSVLENFLNETGYIRTINRNGKFNLDYSKDYGKKPSALKDPWAERNHAGISLQYDCFVEKAALLTIRIPLWKVLLSKFSSMDDELKEFVTENALQCIECGYCIQTDKTGQAKLKNVEVSCNDKKIKICPYFPGYNFAFTEINKDTAEIIIKFLKWIDKTLNE